MTEPTTPAPLPTGTKLAKYTYHGPVTGSTVTIGTEQVDLRLFPGREVEAPAEDPYVRDLIELGHLKPVGEPDAKATKKKGGK